MLSIWSGPKIHCVGMGHKEMLGIMRDKDELCPLLPVNASFILL